MFYLVPETGTRKIWYQIAWHTYQFLVPVSGQYVMGIMNAFFLWGFLRLCQFWWKSIKKCDRESARRRTDTLTDANWFYNLSHAMCYSYGTDNNVYGAVFTTDSLQAFIGFVWLPSMSLPVGSRLLSSTPLSAFIIRDRCYILHWQSFYSQANWTLQSSSSQIF